MRNNLLIETILEEIHHSISTVHMNNLEMLINLLDKKNRIFCDGAGRSRLQIEGFAMRLTQMGYLSAVVGEPTAPAITDNDLLLICSGSGETPILVEHAMRAKSIGAQTVVITANPNSSLAQTAGLSVLIEASAKNNNTSTSIQPMGSLFEQSAGILCDMIVLLLMRKHHISSEDMYKNHSNLE